MKHDMTLGSSPTLRFRGVKVRFDESRPRFGGVDVFDKSRVAIFLDQMEQEKLANQRSNWLCHSSSSRQSHLRKWDPVRTVRLSRDRIVRMALPEHFNASTVPSLTLEESLLLPAV